MESPIDWAAPVPSPCLQDDEIHLWRAALYLEPPALTGLRATLTTDEKSRADRFVFPRDRDRFTAARGILRELLGAYLRRPAADVQIVYGAQGKPALADANREKDVRFNLSHAGGLAAYAFALGRDVGVDVETIRPDFASDEIATRFFSPDEVDELQSVPLELRAEAFFLCWTRKEAYIKARGEGLQIPLDSFRVTLTPGKPEHLHSADSSRWTLRSFLPADGYAGALVGEGQGWNARYWQWKSPSGG